MKHILSITLCLALAITSAQGVTSTRFFEDFSVMGNCGTSVNITADANFTAVFTGSTVYCSAGNTGDVRLGGSAGGGNMEMKNAIDLSGSNGNFTISFRTKNASSSPNVTLNVYLNSSLIYTKNNLTTSYQTITIPATGGVAASKIKWESVKSADAGNTSGNVYIDDILITQEVTNIGCQACTGITAFEVPGQIGTSVIDTVTGTINVTVGEGTNVKALKPNIETKGDTAVLLWNKSNDDCPHLYSSIARNGSTKNYSVQYAFVPVTLPEYHFKEGYDATLGITSGITTTLGSSTSQNHGLYANGSKCFAATTTYYGGSITTPVVRTAGVFKFWVMGSSAATGISFKVEKIVNGVTTLLADFPQPHGKNWTEYVVVANDPSPAIQLRITTYDCTVASLYFDDLSLTSFAGSNKPSIANVRTSPQYPEAAASTAIMADITDSDDSVQFAKVVWGKEKSKVTNVADMTKINGNAYKSSNIQAAEGDTVFYKIMAFDNYFVSDTTALKYYIVLHSYARIEDFSSTSISAGFSSGNFSNNNITWSYTSAKASTLEGKSITLNANGTLHATIPQGVGMLRFDYSSALTANIEIQSNSVKMAEVKTGTEATTADMMINSAAGATLKIINKSTAEIAIDNIRWDDFKPVTITQQPLTMQLYPALPDSGTVRFAGTANATSITGITFSAYKNNSLYKSVNKTLTFINNVADFDLSIKIPAELTNFEFRYTTNLMAKEDTLARNVVAGDVYIISGQSNGAAGTSIPKDSISEFFRAYGRMYKPGTEGDVYDPEAATWGKANSKGASYTADYFNGYSGYVLSKNILQKQNRPSLILNVSVGGTSIDENLPGEDHYDQNTIYGRGLYRAQKAGVQDCAKAIIWVQGEGNQNSTYATYGAKFATLRSAWKTDYPAVQKIYVSQINLGCSGYTALGSELREAQRKLQDAYSDVEVMSNVGIPIRYDSCHYTPEGYDLLYGRYYDLLARDFYGVQKDLINPPNVQKVFFVNQSLDTIAIKFNQEIVLPQPMYGRQMKDYFYNENKVQIATSQLIKYSKDSTIILLIASGNINATKLTYGPDAYVRAKSRAADTLYVGPWLTNIRGISALTFDKLAIGRENLDSNGQVPVQKSRQAKIVSFTIANQVGQTIIDTAAKTVTLTMPYATNLTALSPTVTISAGASIKPASGVAKDFSAPVNYTVTAEDTTVKISWTVTVSKEQEPPISSTECSIRSFKIDSYNGVIKDDTIRVRNLPVNADLSALLPTILISDKATISPASNTVQDFRTPVTYTVTAEDGISKKVYVVVATKKEDATGIESELYKQLHIYPNPVRSVLHIRLPKAIEKVELYNMQGTLVKQSRSTEINVSNLPKGSYIIKVYVENGIVLTRKVTVSK